MTNSNRAQFAVSMGSVIALILLIAIGAVVVSQVTGTFAPSSLENVSHPIEGEIRCVAERGGTSFSLLTILVIVGVAVLTIVFVSSSLRTFGGEFEK